MNNDIPTISVDLDKKCTRCKKPGATQSGYCLACIAKMVGEGKFDHILKRPRGAGETPKRGK